MQYGHDLPLPAAPLIIFIITITVVVLSVLSQDKVIRIPLLNVNYQVKFHYPPLVAVLILLLMSPLPGSLNGLDIWVGGFIGEGKVFPYKTMIQFVTLSYVCISLDMTGLLAYIALKAIQAAGSSGRKLFFYFYFLASAFTICTSNDIVILTLTPIIYYCTRVAKISPYPMLFGEFFTANICSMVLVIGNPVNLIVANANGLSFATYSNWMAAPALVGSLTCCFLMYLLFRKDINVDFEPPSLNPEACLRDRRGILVHGAILFLTRLCLGIADGGLTEGWIITTGAAFASLCYNLYYWPWEIPPSSMKEKELTELKIHYSTHIIERKNSIHDEYSRSAHTRTSSRTEANLEDFTRIHEDFFVINNRGETVMSSRVEYTPPPMMKDITDNDEQKEVIRRSNKDKIITIREKIENEENKETQHLRFSDLLAVDGYTPSVGARTILASGETPTNGLRGVALERGGTGGGGSGSEQGEGLGVVLGLSTVPLEVKEGSNNHSSNKDGSPRGITLTTLSSTDGRGVGTEGSNDGRGEGVSPLKDGSLLKDGSPASRGGERLEVRDGSRSERREGSRREGSRNERREGSETSRLECDEVFTHQKPRDPLEVLSEATEREFAYAEIRCDELTSRASIVNCPWAVLPFVFGMFALVSGLKNAGWIDAFANYILEIIPSDQGNSPNAIATAIFLMTTISFVLCSLIDNQPASILLTQVLIAPSFDRLPSMVRTSGMLGVLEGANIGGCWSLMGALAGIMWSTLLRNKGITIGYLQFLGVGLRVMPLVTFLVALFIWGESVLRLPSS